MGILGRLIRRQKRPEKDFLVAQVLSRHRAWYPAHNRGCKAPAAAIHDWMEKLRCLSQHELILLLADNHARNCILGKKWPPYDKAHVRLFPGAQTDLLREKKYRIEEEKMVEESRLTAMQVKEIEKFLNELMGIGQTDGYLSMQPGGKFNDKSRNIRAIEIGQGLNKIGGMDAMRLAGAAIRQFLGSAKARELEYCWDGIGSWHG